MNAKQPPVPGVSLIEVLRHKSTFDEPALKGILLPIADVLEKAHDDGKLHLAISPATIILQGGATPVLAGFDAGPNALPDAGYSAIERYSQDYRTGRWTDIYSLGAVAYRLISGSPPPAATARVEGEPMRSAVEIGARNYHKSLLEAIDWALNVHPLERPQNLAQWKDALIGLRESVPSRGAASAATAPITATTVRKFAEARQSAPNPNPPPANVTPVPPPVVEKPKPKPMAPPPPVEEPFPELPPSRPSLFSAVLAVIVLGTAIGYAWFAQRPKPAPIAPEVVEQPPAALEPAPSPPPQAASTPSTTAAAEPTPAPQSAAPAQHVEADPQLKMTRELAAKLQGDWFGRAAYASVLRGLDCSVSVARSWKSTIRGATTDGKSIRGNFSTVLQADGDKACPKVHYDVEVDGEFTARVVSPTALQVSSRVNSCNGNCDDNRGLLLYKALNRTYRVSVSGKADRLSFTDNATDFDLRRQ